MFSPTNILTTDTVYWSMSSCDTILYWWRNINTGFHSGSYYVGYGLPGELDKSYDGSLHTHPQVHGQKYSKNFL